MASRIFDIFSLSRTLELELHETKPAEDYLGFITDRWNDTKNLYVEQDSINNRVISYITLTPNPECEVIFDTLDQSRSGFKYVIFEHLFCGEVVTNVICQSSLIKTATVIPGFRQLDGIIVPNRDSKLLSASDPQHGVPSHSLISAVVEVDARQNTVTMTVDDVSSSFGLEVMREFLAFSPNRFTSPDNHILSATLCEHLDSEIVEANYHIIVSAVYNDIKGSVHVNKSAVDIRSSVRSIIDKLMEGHGLRHTTAQFNRAYIAQKDKTFRSIGELFRTHDIEMYTTWHKQYLIKHIKDAIAKCKEQTRSLTQDMIAKIYAPIVKAYLFLDFVYIGNVLYHKSRWTHYLRQVGVKDLLLSLRTIVHLIQPSDLNCAESYDLFVRHINHLKYVDCDTFFKSHFDHEYSDAENLLNETRGIMAWEDCVSEVVDETLPDGKHRLRLRLRAGRIEDFVTFKCGSALGFNVESGEIEIDEAEEHEFHAGIKDWFGKMFVDRSTRRAVKRLIGALLIGDNLSKIVVFLDGIGNNSKTALLEIMKNVLGDYYVVTSVSLLMANAQKKDSANASPDVLKLKGRRIAIIFEPSPNIMFDPGALKSKSSRDDDKARPLYGKVDIAFKAMYMIWVACNNPPKIENADLQSLRRALIVPMKSRFLEECPITDIEQQYLNRVFPADLNFNTYIGRWKATFGRLMIKWCQKYMAEGNNFGLSQEITQATDFYRHSNSEMMTFTRKYIETSDNPDDIIPYASLMCNYNVVVTRLFGSGSFGNMGRFLSLIKTFVFGKCTKDGIDCNVWDDQQQVLCGYKLVDI